MTTRKRNDIINPSSEGSKEDEQEERNHAAAVSGSPQDARRLGRGQTRHQGHPQQEEEPQDQVQGKGVGRMTVFEQLECEMLQQKVAIWRILSDMNTQDMIDRIIHSKNKPGTNPNKGKKKIQMRKI